MNIQNRIAITEACVAIGLALAGLSNDALGSQPGSEASSGELVITAVEDTGNAIEATWPSKVGEVFELWISGDLEEFVKLREVAGAAGETSAQVLKSSFPDSRRGFLRVRRVPTRDPVTQTSFPCYYIHDYTWNYGGNDVGLVGGRIRFPSATCDASDGPPADRPVVIFTHGEGMNHHDHAYLMAHLARNGFVTASISNSGSNESRGLTAISFLNAMHAFWGWKDRLSNEVVFAGHSRGGEGAVTAARLLAEQPSLGHISYEVKAVVSIAPTDGGGSGGNMPKEHLDGTMTRSFLGLYGSHDSDVAGSSSPAPLGPAKTVFAIYDRAGTESSVEGLLLPHANLIKGMVFVHGGSHRGFLGQGQGFMPTIGGRLEQQNIARGYFNAFLRWHVFGQSAYRAYFDGTATPTTVAMEEDFPVFTQFSNVSRRVIDNCEQGGWAQNTRGGSVIKGPGIAQIAENDLWQLDPSAPHDTGGIRIKWAPNPLSYVRWAIPDDNVPMVGPARDVTGYKFLSLRVAQDYKDAWNSAGEDQDFYVRLSTGGGWSVPVKISDHGCIPYPNPFIIDVGDPVESNSTGPGDYTKSAMSTVRIPLEAFDGADLSNVVAVHFFFTVPGHDAGSVIVDSLEFSRNKGATRGGPVIVPPSLGFVSP